MKVGENGKKNNNARTKWWKNKEVEKLIFFFFRRDQSRLNPRVWMLRLHTQRWAYESFSSSYFFLSLIPVRQFFSLCTTFFCVRNGRVIKYQSALSQLTMALIKAMDRWRGRGEGGGGGKSENWWRRRLRIKTMTSSKLWRKHFLHFHTLG